MHFSIPRTRFKKKLDPPWDDWLGHAMKLTANLILLNTTLVFILAAISAIAVDLRPQKTTSTYVQRHTMLLQAELIFFYCMIPLVYLVVSVSENLYLWNDNLRPLYVVSAAVIGLNVWILQLILWAPCVLTKSGGGPGYCPYVFRGSIASDYDIWTAGSKSMVVYAVPTLFIFYIAYLAFGAIGFRRERKKPVRAETFSLAKAYTSASQSFDRFSSETLPLRNPFVRNHDSPPDVGRGSDPYASPKAGGPNRTDSGNSRRSNSLEQNEPAIALMLTTPHGTTEQRDPFDDDRLSRLGYRPAGV